uniref:Uncharacterized protein n=1 Tax=viral metagenome TaxID=1070528 RepID=A0A6C0E8B8_9ZZZZ
MFKFEKWSIQQKLIGLIVLAFCLCWFLRSNAIERFIDGDFCDKCPDRLLTDGNKYYLLNTKLPINKTNPIIFNSLDDYSNNKPTMCPQLNPITKDNEPVLPLQHKCNRENALTDVKYNECSYGIYDRSTKEECKKIIEDNKEVNLAINRCMMDQIIKNNTQLNPFS